jgi:hypothetical protein
MSDIVTISDLEIQDLMSQAEAITEDGAALLPGDPVGCAEGVARVLVERRNAPIPGCHSLAPDPMGWEDCAECGACFDRLTCIVSLHRLGRERPGVMYLDEIHAPVSLSEAEQRVPIAGRLVTTDGLDNMSTAELVDVAKQAGHKAHRGMSKSTLRSKIRQSPKATPSKQVLSSWVVKSGFAPGDVLEPHLDKWRQHGGLCHVTTSGFRLVVGDEERMCKSLRSAMTTYGEVLGLSMPAYGAKKFWRRRDGD